MKKLLFLLLLIPFLGTSQGTFTAPVGYNTGAPTAAPSGVGTRWRFDLLTGKKYTWNPDAVAWDEDPRGIDQISGCSAPLYTPGYNQSIFAVNGCTSGQGGPKLYLYNGSTWDCLNCASGPTYTAGTGIAISGGNVISNTGDLSTTNELQDLSLSGQTLSLTSDATPVTLPIINVVAGAGISVSIVSGAATVTNTGDTDASDDITTGTSLGGDLSGTLPNPDVVGLQSVAVSAATPSHGEVLTYNSGTSEWEPAAPASGGHVIRDDGTDMTQRAALNFVSTSTVAAAATDDAGNGETEIRLTVPTNGITATEIAADAVGSSEIAADAVGSSEIAADAVGSSEIATDAVGSSEIVADAVGSSELASTAVTPGSYTYMSGTVDADGRLTAASSGAAPVTGTGTADQVAVFNTSTSVSGSSNLTYVSSVLKANKSYTNTTDANVSLTGNVPLINFGGAVTDRWTIGKGYVSGDVFSFLYGNAANPSVRVLDIYSNGAVITAGNLRGNTMSTTSTGNSFGAASPPANVHNYFFSTGGLTGRNRFLTGSSTLYVDMFCNQSAGRNYTFANNYFSGTDLNLLRSTSPSGLPTTLVWSVDDDGDFGFFTSTPSQPVDINGNTRLRAALYDGLNSAGTSGYVLSSTGSATQWKSAASVLAGSTYVPTGTSDPLGSTGDFSYDSNYIYVKTSAGWKRTALSTF